MLEIRIDEAVFEPFVKSLVTVVLSEQENLQPPHNNQLAYTEAEAASMLGLHQHQLRDLRLDGRIGYTRIVGNRIRYTMQDLTTYLHLRKEEIVR